MNKVRATRLGVVFHCFNFYRRSTLERLVADKDLDCQLVGDRRDPFNPPSKPGALPVWIPDEKVFVEAPCRRIGNSIWQPRIISYALRSANDTLIFLGNPRFPAVWLATIAARLTGKRVLFWTIGWYKKDSRLTTLVKRVFFSLPNGILMYGNQAKQEAIRLGFRPEDIHVVYNSLDYDKQKIIREQLASEDRSELRKQLFGDRSDLPIVVCVSRLTAKRQLDVLLRAMRRIQSSHNGESPRELNLLIVGDGADTQKLKNLAHELGIHAHFYGACFDEEQLARLLSISTVTVAPGMVGLLTMLSFAYGVPVLTHNDPFKQSPESEAVVPGKTGDLFGFGNDDELASLLLRWTETIQPRPEIQANCFTILDHFYNPDTQATVIKRAALGQPAQDLSWDLWPNAADASNDSPSAKAIEST